MTKQYNIKNLNWNTWICNGERAVVQFDNGYKASCLRGGLFHTGNGTYEIGVMDKNGLTYDTPITDDVLGYLSEEEANQALYEISQLPARGDHE